MLQLSKMPLDYPSFLSEVRGLGLQMFWSGPDSDYSPGSLCKILEQNETL